MPVLSKAEEPEKFTKVLAYAIGTLSLIFIIFGEVTVFAFGTNLDEPFVTQMLPAGSYMVSLIKILFCMNLVCSYAITVNPTNTIIESYLFSRKNSIVINGRYEKSRCEVFGSKISRFLVVCSAGILGIVLAADMDKFLGFIGALLGSPMAITLPALIHYRTVAESKCERLTDILLVILSFFCLGFSTALSLESILSSSSKAT